METTQQPVTITETAIQQVREIITNEGPDFKAALRIYVQGGGCSGFSYGFSFDEETAEDDWQFDRDGVKVVIDPMSMQYLQGSVIDFKKAISGSNFVISNPNATTTCGCGSSFAA